MIAELNETLKDNVLDVFKESEKLKCLLPRYANVRRFDTMKGRGYAVQGGAYTEPTFNFGLTTWLSMSTDGRDEKILREFDQKHGTDAPRVLRELADFGTLGHIFTGELFTQGYINTGYEFQTRIMDFMYENGMPLWKVAEYTDLMAAYMFSMSCFAHERRINVFAVEMPVTDFSKGITTCIDLICGMDDCDAKGNVIGRINATINFKFRNTPAAYEKDEHQTNIEGFMLNNLIEQGLTKMPNGGKIDKCFVLCPKKITSRTRDNYFLSDTTGKYTLEDFERNHIIRQMCRNKPLFVDIDKPLPMYKNTQIKLGVPPQYQTLRERMNQMFSL